jgi:hypothetical protein
MAQNRGQIGRKSTRIGAKRGRNGAEFGRVRVEFGPVVARGSAKDRRPLTERRLTAPSGHDITGDGFVTNLPWGEPPAVGFVLAGSHGVRGRRRMGSFRKWMQIGFLWSIIWGSGSGSSFRQTGWPLASFFPRSVSIGEVKNGGWALSDSDGWRFPEGDSSPGVRPQVLALPGDNGRRNGELPHRQIPKWRHISLPLIGLWRIGFVS